MREKTERHEALNSGVVKLVGTNVALKLEIYPVHLVLKTKMNLHERLYFCQ
jgi:UDP-N-acetylglucosamine 2-epimerase